MILEISLDSVLVHAMAHWRSEVVLRERGCEADRDSSCGLDQGTTSDRDCT